MEKLIAATSTPLASIFGSGFLIIVPILSGAGRITGKRRVETLINPYSKSSAMLV
jgi:hypothetical protein